MTRRWITRLLLGAGLVILAVAALVACGWYWLGSNGGRVWLAAELSERLSTPGQTIRIDGLSGRAPFALRAARVAIADAKGTWLTVDGLDYRIDALALLSRRLIVPHLSADRIEVIRTPAASASATPGSWHFIVPSLPVAVELPHLDVARIDIGASLLGQQASLALHGGLGIEKARATAHMVVSRTDGVAGGARFDLVYGADALNRPGLELTLDAHEPTGILMRALAPRGGKLPLTIMLKGAGTLDDWRGHLEAHAATQAMAAADFTATDTGQGWRIAASGTAHLLALLPPSLGHPIGDRLGFDIEAAVPANGPIALDKALLRLAAGQVALSGRFTPGDGTLQAQGAGDLDLADFSALANQPLAGRGHAGIILTGNLPQLRAEISLSGKILRAGAFAARAASVALTATSGDGRDYRIDAKGEFADLTNANRPLPAALGTRLGWSGTLSTADSFKEFRLTQGLIEGSGVQATATGDFRTEGPSTGETTLHIDDLASLASLLGRRFEGAADLAATLHRQANGTTAAELRGDLRGLKTGIALADALGGGDVALTGNATRAADGQILLSRLEATSGAAHLSGQGSFDPGKARFAGQAEMDVPHLEILQKPLDIALSGGLTIHLSASGAPRNPAFEAAIDGQALAIHGTAFQTLHLTAASADFGRDGAALTADLASGRLTSHAAATLSPPAPERFRIADLTLTGSALHARGGFDVDTRTALLSGTLAGSAADFGPWSALAGQQLSGSGDFSVRLGETKGQTADISAHLHQPALDMASAEDITGRASLTDLYGHPAGSIDLALADGRGAGWTLAQARLHAATLPGSRVARFELDLAGRTRETFTLAAAGTAQPDKVGGSLSLSRFDGTLAGEPVRLYRPLLLSRHGPQLAATGLDAGIGGGRLTGNLARDAHSLALALRGHGLALAPLGRLAGQEGLEGTLSFDAALSGANGQPRGSLTIAIPDLKLAADEHPELPALNFSAEARLGPRAAAVSGRIVTLRHESVTMQGSVPIQALADGEIRLDDAAPLRLSVLGDGRLEDVSSVLPLGEDSLGGGFHIDLQIAGTPAAPQASGNLAIRDGAYTDLATGIALQDLQAELDGNQAALELRRFSAQDGTGGAISGSGRVLLGTQALDLSLALRRFTVTHLDTATVLASGSARVTGPLRTPQLAGSFTLDRADIQIPDRLPANVPSLNVSRIDSLHPHRLKPAPVAVPDIVAVLQIKIEAPGQLFVEGQGLNSEWRADLGVTGTSAAPNIAGKFTAIRGTYALLGKSFSVKRGEIRFSGGASLDPTLDILAERIASDITAQVLIQGTASKPGLTLTSTPQLPQDEVLSRVLFGTGVGQISPVEAIELAQTAAAFTGRAPDVMSKVRNLIGLDQLSVGADAGTSGGTALGGATLSGGKYVAPGVFVGVDKGVSASATKGHIQVDISPHVSLDGTIGAGSSSSSIGLSYRRDY